VTTSEVHADSVVEKTVTVATTLTVVVGAAMYENTVST